MNLNPRTEFLKPIRTTERARELGRKGGIKSGEIRKRKAELRKYYQAFFNISYEINQMNDKEYKEFLLDYTEEEQEQINFYFKPTPQQEKALFKLYI